MNDVTCSLASSSDPVRHDVADHVRDHEQEDQQASQAAAEHDQLLARTGRLHLWQSEVKKPKYKPVNQGPCRTILNEQADSLHCATYVLPCSTWRIQALRPLALSSA